MEVRYGIPEQKPNRPDIDGRWFLTDNDLNGAYDEKKQTKELLDQVQLPFLVLIT